MFNWASTPAYHQRCCPRLNGGSSSPTLPTLLRIALVFGVELDHFVNKRGPRIAVTRKNERLRLPIPAGSSETAYLFESLNFPLAERRIEAFLAEFQPGAIQSEPHQHGSEELIYVVSGQLNVSVEGDETLSEPGTPCRSNSSVSHSYRIEGLVPCSAIVVAVA